MKWEGHETSRNVEDRRGEAPGSGRRPRLGGGKGLGLGTIVIALVAGWIFGINPMTVLGVLSGGGPGDVSAPVAQQAPAAGAQPADREGLFVSTVLRDTERVWGQQFQAAGGQYREPRLVLFRGATPTACGTGESAMGPFYCPGDSKVYIDLDFFDTLSQRLGAPGDFAQAYVIAHEVGHHIQTITGISKQVREAQSRASKAQQNQLQVLMELQADCYAGIWAHHAERSRQILEQGDIEEALAAASAVGDDTIQKRMQGYVQPESFTHGTAQQRMQWFKRGLETGSMQACDTFKAGA
jgi:predicted metalloprotease